MENWNHCKENSNIRSFTFSILKFRKNSLASMGLTSKDWKRNLWVGFVIFLALAIPNAFFVGNTGIEILSGKYSAPQVGIGLFSSFIYFFLCQVFLKNFFQSIYSDKDFIFTEIEC